jgi:hypothetical protein
VVFAVRVERQSVVARQKKVTNGTAFALLLLLLLVLWIKATVVSRHGGAAATGAHTSARKATDVWRRCRSKKGHREAGFKPSFQGPDWLSPSRGPLAR